MSSIHNYSTSEIMDIVSLKSKDELFSDDRETKSLLQLVEEAFHLSKREVNAIPVEGLRALFDLLPHLVQRVAYERGLSDQLFGNNARLYFRRFSPQYRAVLGLRTKTAK